MDQYDIVVVGGGTAGIVAALTAAEAGATVALVEATSELGGTSRYSAGNLWSVTGPGALDHLRALSFGKTPDDVLQAYIDGLAELRSYLADRGLETRDVPQDRLPACWPNFPGADGVEYFAVPGERGSGPALADGLLRVLNETTAVVHLDTRMTRLITDADGAVVGIEAATPSGESAQYRARRGVVLAAGGFESNPNLVDAYLPLSPLESFVAPSRNGDGLVAAQAVGADVWHMSAFFGFWALRTPDFPVAFPLLFLAPGHILVDSDGRRFQAEMGDEAHEAMRAVQHYRPGLANHPHLPAFAILDHRTLSSLPLALFPSANGYRWSHDNSQEVARGWITRADTIDELARLIGVPAAALGQTVSEFNTFAAEGLDPDFGRPPGTMVPLAEGPFSAVRVSPGVATTSGGPRRDALSRVLRTDRTPIPGLYAVGGTGSVWGHLTQHGGGLTDGLVFGRIAVTHALR